MITNAFMEEADNDPAPLPLGDLTIQTVALNSDTNQYGDIYGGWLASKMDLAASIAAAKVARGKVATVAIENISFMAAIHVGSIVSCYSRVRAVGRSSCRIAVEAWIQHEEEGPDWVKVSEGQFVFVATDDNGRTRAIPRESR